MNEINFTTEKYREGALELYDACIENGIEIDSVSVCWDGFKFIFKHFPNGDAVLHSGSYGHVELMWETMGFPWDDSDVSFHTVQELVMLIKTLYAGHYEWHD